MNLRPLYRWYEIHKRDLPFRGTGEVYRIWLSEVMLQQTRVGAMLPVYNRFLDRFPDLESLAAAGEEEVLAAWRGLGYYSRAKNLLKGVRRVVENLAGEFPSDYDEALKVPGIGPYTASAILSIHHNLPLPVMDGNVRRVLWRLCAGSGSTEFSAKELEGIAHEMMRKRGAFSAGDHNQALMELGALICIPGRPLCEECPLKKGCGAYRMGGPILAGTLPPAKRKEQLGRRLELFLLIDPAMQGIWIVRDSGARFFRRDFFFPFHEMEWQAKDEGGAQGRESSGTIEKGEKRRLRLLRSTPGLEWITGRVPVKKIALYGRTFRHQITQHKLELGVRWIHLDSALSRLLQKRAISLMEEGVVWRCIDLSELNDTIVSSVAKKIRPALEEALREALNSRS